MLKVGSLFAERYNILEHLAAGGTADVYKAEDKAENRLVAIKILKPELSDDKDFIRRFRIEGQATSSIDSDNIVRVYDVGNVGDVYYIAMEYIDGVTLKQYIRRKGTLSARETMAIAAQVAVGLRAAHSRHVIHRDIKPQNIMLSRDGKAKVTDFGIARAVTDETRTMNVATMGSVHYIAPEQAKGMVCDERSDIYSLGICMYEMITGRVPFDKETSVAVALAHMNEAMVPPSKLNEQCPRALEQIIFRCTQKSSARRYHNCSELLKDLKTAVADPNYNFEQQEQEELLRSNTQIIGGAGRSAAGRNAETNVPEVRNTVQKPAAGAGTAAVAAAASAGSVQKTSAGSVQKTSANAVQKASEAVRTKPVRLNDFEEVEDSVAKPSKEAKETAAVSKAGGNSAKKVRNNDDKKLFEEDRKDDGRTTFDRILMIIGIVVGAACILMAVYLIGSLSGCIKGSGTVRTTAHAETSGYPTMEDESIETIDPNRFDPEVHTVVPNVIGMSYTSAVEALTQAELDFKVSQQFIYSDEYEPGTIIRQNYPEGTIVYKGSKIVIQMSAGTDKFVIKPTYVGNPLNSFKNDISKFGSLYNVTYERVLSDEYPVNRIISLDPSEGILEQGDSIHVVYSGGPAHVTVPDLIGMSRDKAMGKLDSSGLTVGTITTEYDRNIDEGCVISQQYLPGASVANGSKVDIVVSLGPEMADIPNVVGMIEAEAVTSLDELGFKVEIVDYYKPLPVEESSEAAESTAESAAETESSSESDLPAEPEVYADVEYGQVAAVSPEAGISYPIGDTVRVYVLRERTESNVPDVLGDTEQEAVDDLTEHGFKTITVKEKETDVATEIGVVIEISPAPGTLVSLTDEVIIYIGIEKQTESSSEAPSSSEPESSSVPESSSSEESSSAAPESSTEQAAKTATIPNIVGDSEEQARSALAAVGFKAENIHVVYEDSDYNNKGLVFEVNPSVGSTISVDTVITIKVGLYTEPSVEPLPSSEQAEIQGNPA